MSDLLKEFGIEAGGTASMVPAEPSAEPQPAPADAGGQPQAGPPATPIDPGMGAQNALGGAEAVLTGLKNVAKDVGIGLTEAVPAVGQGAVKAINELSNTAKSIGDWADRYVPLGQIDLSNPLKPQWKPGTPEKNDAQLPEFFKPSTTTGHMIEGVSQFITSYAIGGKLLRMLGVAPAVTAGGKIVTSAAQTAFAGAAGFDPAEARLSNLLRDNLGLRDPVTEFLASSPEDGEALGRFKNALEQVLLNGPVDAVFYGVKGLQAKRLGKLAEAEEAAKLAEDSFTLWREQHADARGEVLDRGGSGLPAPAKVDVDALEAAQQGGMYGAPGTVTPDNLTGLKPGEGGPQAPVGAAVSELPPVPEGHVRVWHAGTDPHAHGESGVHVSGGRDYAEGWKEMHGGDVWYADVPADSPWLLKVEGTDHVQNSVAPDGTQFTKIETPAAPVEAPPTALPRDLSGATPRYNYGSKGFGLEFESDVEKALFITSQKSKSARDADYRDWLKKVGYSDEEINTLGQVVRDNIKARAAQELGDTLSIGQIVERPGKNTDGTRVAPKESLPQAPVFDQQNLLDTFVLARGHYGWNLDTFSGSIIGKNMARVNNENDAKAFFNVLGVVEEKAFQAANGRPRTVGEMVDHANKELEKLADYTGVDVRELRVRMAADAANLDGLATRVAGYRMATEVYSKRAAELARKVIAGDASEFGGSLPALQAEFLKTAQTLLAIAPLTEGVKSGLGRNLSLLRANIGPGKEKIGSLAGIMDTGAKPPKLGPDGAPVPHEPTPGAMAPEEAALAGDLQKALEGGPAGIERLARKLALADNPKAAKKIVDDAFGPGLMDLNNEVWINGLLSGPKTHVVNMITSAIKSAVVMPTEQLVSGILRADTAAMRMAADQYVGMFLAMKDALRVTGTALKQGDAVLDPTHMALGGQGAQHALTPETLGLQTESPLGKLVEGFGNMVRLPGRLLTTEDELLKQLNYRGRLYSLAMREGREMKRAHPDMTDEKLAEFVAEYVERGFDEAGRGVNPEAMAYARDATFTNDLKADTWRGTKSVGESVNEMAINHPGLRVILPFTRVPTNIMRDAWDHTPGMNLLRKQWWSEFMAGGERRSMAAAKFATGGALWAAAITMAINGDITGGLSSDPNIRKQEQDAQKVPNALRFYDEDGKPYYVEYGRLQPYATFFSIAATVAESAGHVDEWKMEDIAGSLLSGLAKNIESQTYLQGLTNVLAAMADPDRRGPKFLERQLASYVPSVTNTFKGADFLLEPHGIVQSMQARTREGQNGAVDAHYNLLGEKVEFPKAFGPQWLSPFTLGKPNDPVLTELARLAQVHKGGLSYPGKKVGNVDLTDLVMGDKSAHARLQELAGEVKNNGMTLRERLTDFFNSDQYKNVLKDGDSTYDGGRMYQTQAILQVYRETAKAALARENPEFAALWRADDAKKINTIRFGKQP